MSDVKIGLEDTDTGVSFLATIVVPLEEVPYDIEAPAVPVPTSAATTTGDSIDSNASSTPGTNL